MTDIKPFVPKEILEFLNKLNETGDFWLVGGCVRDILLGRTPKDYDIVTTTPEAVPADWKQLGKDFPVWQVRVGSHTVEIASARTERKTGVGHNGFEVQLTKDLKQDLLRRDLTINTFAWRSQDGLTHAPGAFSDLRDKVLCHVSIAFAEDPLRVFRVARFAAQLGFEVSVSTLTLMNTLGWETLSLPKDRVREEMTKALRGPHPDRFFSTLSEAGCDQWFPEVMALKDKPHSEIHHSEGDAWNHSLLALRKARDLGANDVEMLCVLGHDFGKALTDPAKWPRHLEHETLGLQPIKAFCDRLGYGAQVLHAMQLVCEKHMIAHSAQELRPSTIRKMVKGAARSVIGIKGFALCCQSDHCGRGGHWDDEYNLQAYMEAVQEAMKSVVVDKTWNPQKIEQAQIASVKRLKDNLGL